MDKLLENIEHISDSTLWNQLRTGDEEAFSFLFERYYSQLVNYGRTLTPEKDIVKDCVQDVFLDVWVYRHKLNEVNVIKSYLLASVRKRIARLHEREHIFSRAKNIDSMEFLFDFSIDNQLINNEETAIKVEKLNKYINNLPPRQKEALYLRYHQNLSVEQVAKVLNMNYQSTKNLLHRAILKLRADFPLATMSFLLGFPLNN